MFSLDASLLQQTSEWASSEPFNATFALMLAVFVFVFIASFVHDNYSWVDRTWSIVPVVYTWVDVAFAAKKSDLAGGVTAKAMWTVANTPKVLFAIVIAAWGVRLTFNFYRRGGYFRGGEDYRWNHVRTWPLMGNPVVWTLFNFFVISLFQTWLLWAITLPIMSLPMEPATALDYLFVGGFAVLLFFETVCDNQQWRFQNAKLRSKEGPLKYGFCVTGAFGYSRHLNVFCEASMWTVLATAAWARPGSSMERWQWGGCVTLIALVHFSTGVITERLTMRKYPLYRVYTKTTPMLFPAFTSTTERTLYLLEKATAARR